MTVTSDQIEALVESEMDYGMSHEQIKNFVINSHVTGKRQLRQVLIEVERRNHDRKKVQLDLQRKQIEIDRLEDRLATIEDPYDRQLLELDIQEFYLDLGKFKVTLHQNDNEMAAFMEWVNKNYGSIEDIQKEAYYDEEEERKYWIARMGKQAAMDIYCTGRVGIGNIDSIAMMKEEDQVYALSVAYQYSGLLNAGIAKIQNQLKPHLDKLMADGTSPRLPTFDNIEDNLNLELFKELTGSNYEQKSLQSPDKPETK
tara:strand:+ start:2529 stop:3299 length:771 start_codon:yes stop_codon:yes gene_type:complete